MSKLSFRARALDANKSLPVFHEEDVPDLPDITSVNRVVPQMPTGMEKEEETEHHLQRAISAQQIYGEAQRLIIPTPDTVLYDSDYQKLRKLNVQIPKQLIHVQAFTLEDELPDYDCDDLDMEWIEKYNKSNSNNSIRTVEFEKMIDTIEKGCGSRIELFTLSDAQALLRKNEELVSSIYEYWKTKKLANDCVTLTPSVRTEKKDGNTFHDPYVAFRRRVEKMQTRKNRKNDEASYEKMLRLRRDLNRACVILEMVKLREQQKRDLLHTTIKILETRASNKDFSGELLHQCYDLIKNRPIQPSDQTVSRLSSLNNNNITKPSIEKLQKQSELLDERLKRNEVVLEENRKRHKLKLQTSVAKSEDVSSTDVVTTTTTSVAHTRVEPDHSFDGPDGKYSFRRKKGVIYHAPRYDSLGNWPWSHPVEGGSADSRFCYCYSSITKNRRCIRFARRRSGRGGRYLFDRAYTPYDEFIPKSTKFEFSESNVTFQDRVPPWPHFKPKVDSSSSDDEDTCSSYTEKTNYHFNRWCNKELYYSNRTNFGPRLQRTHSTSNASKQSTHPYSMRTTINDNTNVNNQNLVASVPATNSRLPKSLNSNNPNASNKGRKNGLNFLSTQLSIKKSQNLAQHISPSRQASTAPASAIYQLNFPLNNTTHSKSSDNKSKVTITSSSPNKKPSTETPVKQNMKQTVVTLVNYISRSNSVISSGAGQSIMSRQPLSIVQERSFIGQKQSLPNNTGQVQLSNLQVQSVNSVRANKLSISKGLTITHSPVVSNGMKPTQAGIQVAR